MKIVAIPTRILGLLLCFLLAPSLLHAQPEDPVHAQLRAMRDDLLDAVNKRDMDRVLGHLDPDVVVTWQNAEVSRKPDGVRAYMSRMLDGPDSIVRSFNTSVAVDELTILHGGDTGIAFGSSRDRFELRGGRTFELTGRWTATVVLDGGAWKIASFHASTNLFDNPLLNAARRLLTVVGAVAAAAGIVVGFLFGRSRKRRTTL